MNKGLISIGSNQNRKENLSRCIQLLKTEFGNNIILSETFITTPYGSNYKEDFVNQLAFIYTNKNKEDIINLSKELEIRMGRTPEDKKNGIVVIDVDLIIWNNDILKKEDMKRDYIINLLPSLLDNMGKDITTTALF